VYAKGRCPRSHFSQRLGAGVWFVATVTHLNLVVAQGIGSCTAGVSCLLALSIVFAAHDDTTGRELWRARLGDVPSNAPISYLANGKQSR
jgi:hypothetical protein